MLRIAPNSALTDNQIREIRRLAGTLPRRALALRFGVGMETIARIIRGETYRWVTEEGMAQPLPQGGKVNTPEEEAELQGQMDATWERIEAAYRKKELEKGEQK